MGDKKPVKSGEQSGFLLDDRPMLKVKDVASICLVDPEKRDAVRPPRWVPVIERDKQALQYAYRHRPKNSPWVYKSQTLVWPFLPSSAA